MKEQLEIQKNKNKGTFKIMTAILNTRKVDKSDLLKEINEAKKHDKKSLKLIFKQIVQM